MPYLPPRSDEDWQVAYANANSKLESADVYGPEPGACYVAKNDNVQSSLLTIRNFLEAMWKDYDFNDMPEAVACIDRVMNNSYEDRPV